MNINYESIGKYTVMAFGCAGAVMVLAGAVYGIAKVIGIC